MCRHTLCFWLAALVLTACSSTPEPNDAGFNPFTAAIRFYRGPLDHLSAVRTGDCPMYPSDSEYSLQAFQKHGMMKGWFMTLDRLMRCGRDETRLAPRVMVDGKWKSYDPVESNDFW